MVHPRKFVRDYLGVASSQYLARAVLAARGVVSAAALGPGGYGGWNALNLIFDYGNYAACGALEGLDLELPAAVASGDRERARRLMAGAWSAVVVGGTLFALALALYLAAGGRAFSTWPGWGLPALMLAAALMQLAFQYLASSLRAHGRFHRVSAGQAAQALIGGGLGLALVWRYGAWGLLVGWLAGTLVALIWMRRGATEAPLAPAGPRVGLALVRAGLPIFGYFAVSLLLRSVDRLALVHYAGAHALGLYSLGLMAAGLVLYFPEAAAYVLFPRLAAAARGAGDPERARAQLLQTQRALTVVLPLGVGLALQWADPVVTRLLPAFRDGVPALRLLAIGALMLSAATLPGYQLLASGRRGRLLAVGIGAALANAALVFAVASREPTPGPVALAATGGYTLFAIAVLSLAAGDWFARARERLSLLTASLAPSAWAGILALALCSSGPDSSVTGALGRSAAVALGYAPMLWWFGRGVGIARLAREWWAARRAPSGVS